MVLNFPTDQFILAGRTGVRWVAFVQKNSILFPTNPPAAPHDASAIPLTIRLVSGVRIYNSQNLCLRVLD